MKKERLFMTACCFLFLFGIFASPVWSATTGTHELTLAVHPGTVVNINRTEASGSKCTVCVGEGSNQCLSKASLTEPGKFSVTFTCTKPWDVFTVETIKKIECRTKPCKHTVMPTDQQPLFEFNRTFHWCLRAPVRMTFHVDFSNIGLTQIAPSDTCSDGHTYSLVALETTKNVHLGLFCASGTISGIQILNGGKVVLMVPGGQKLEPKGIDVSWGEDIKSLAVVSVGLPNGKSSQEFFSPNYPKSFPDDDLMTWNISVPDRHESTVKLLDHSEPHCRKKEPGIEYEYDDVTVVRKLSERQPTGEEGSFALSLRNCEMDVVRSRAEAVGLTLHFRVSSNPTGSEEPCTVDLSKESSLSLHIAKTADSRCKLKLNSISVESATVPPGKKSIVSFRDCPKEDLLLTVNKTIGCQQLKDCPSRPVPLTVPQLERCLPESLTTVHWNLQAPNHGTVELWAYIGKLRQSLPGQACNGSVQFSVSESDGTAIGQFCPGGIIAEVQVHRNVTVTATPRNDLFLTRTFQTFFKVSFTKEIRETYIFHIAPKKDVTSVLVSPGWPGGMKPYATASWIATVPDGLDVQLTFIEVSQPKCSKRHTSIQVQTRDSQEKLYSRREDEEGDSELVIPESFYLNMSNCLPEKNSFRVMAEITPTKQRKIILLVVLAVVGVLFMGMVIALITVCVVIRKKKKQMAQPPSSIYNPNGHSFLPGLHGVPKTMEDDEDAHIYDYIEDTLVYGHLLREESYRDDYRKPAVDAYRSFNGPTDTKPLKDPEPLSGEPNGDADTEVGVYRPFVPPAEVAAPAVKPEAAQEGTDSQSGERMVENELYSSRGGDGDGGSGPSAAPLSPSSEASEAPWI